MFVDPWGLVVTEWDYEHCTPDEIDQLKENDRLWNNGTEEEKRKAAESSRSIREQYITDADTLLDNGYVETVVSEDYDVSMLDGGVKIYTRVQYKRLYTDKGNYVQVLNVNVKISLSDGFKVENLYINSGQTGLLGATQTEEVELCSVRYSFAPTNWGMVLDDSGASFTIAGTFLTVTVSRGESSVYDITVINQLYTKQTLLDGRIYGKDQMDPQDIFVEGMQRGERDD